MKWLGNTNTFFGSTRQFRVGGSVDGGGAISGGFSGTSSGGAVAGPTASPVVMTSGYNVVRPRAPFNHPSGKFSCGGSGSYGSASDSCTSGGTDSNGNYHAEYGKWYCGKFGTACGSPL